MINYCYHFSICLYLLLFKIFCKQDMPCLILFSVSKILGRLNMSDLAATNCGCGCEGGNNNCLFLILILLFCGGNGNGCGNSGLFGGNDCCSTIIWLFILLSCCGCGNGSSFFGGNGNGCGCGC